MLKTILIDDESDARFVLRKTIENHLNNKIEVIAEADGVLSGIEKIQLLKPDLIFLDIQMRDGSGFDLLDKLKHNCEVIFITAFDKYAIKAFKYTAFDYLLKPFKASELVATINRLYTSEKIGVLDYKHTLKKALDNKAETLNIRDSKGIHAIPLANLIRLEGQNQYTKIISTQQQIVSAKNLKHYEEILDENRFMRVHNRHIVNLLMIKQYISGDGGELVLNNQDTVPVSRSKKKKVVEYMK